MAKKKARASVWKDSKTGKSVFVDNLTGASLEFEDDEEKDIFLYCFEEMCLGRKN